MFCYYEGKKSPHNVDPCPCSHLLYKNVEIEADSQVRLSSQVLEDLKVLKTKKPELAVLLSLGESVVSCLPNQTLCVKKHYRCSYCAYIRLIKIKYPQNVQSSLFKNWDTSQQRWLWGHILSTTPLLSGARFSEKIRSFLNILDPNVCNQNYLRENLALLWR